MLSFSSSVFSQDSGLHITSSFPHFPIDLQSDTLNSAIITFNEAIVFDPNSGGTFTIDDVAIKDPLDNDIIPTDIIAQGNNSYKITFSAQTQWGIYIIKIGPNISDNDGNLMDQDQDGVFGEPEDDVYLLEIKSYDLFSLDKTVTANGSYTPKNEVASNLTDGLLETKWSSGTSDTSWAEIDLEQQMIIHEVIWYGHAVPTGTQSLKLYIDSNLILEQDIIVSYTTPIEFTLNSPVKGRYVKIEISGGLSWKCGFECEIYGYDLEKSMLWDSSDGGNDHYYELIELQDAITWQDAKSIAEATGGHLATITTQEEQDWIVNTFGEFLRATWLGGYQLNPGNDEPAGDWVWITGETWDFTHWWVGEPNNGSGGTEHYLEFYQNGDLGFWNDNPIDGNNRYLVEYPNILNQLVSSVQAVQRQDRSKIVDITYDLSDCDGNIVNIDSYVSLDDGVNWIELLPEFVSGDIGAEVTSGTDKHIEWTPIFNIPFGYYENCKIKIVANYYEGLCISDSIVIDNRITKSGEGTDLNGDGYQDIVFSNYYNDSNVNLNSYIYWGTEDGYNAALKTELTTCGVLANSIADLNGDGYLDIIFSNYYNATRNINSYIYWGDESASFSQKTELATHGARGISIADLNADGYLDIVFSNHYNDITYDINSYIYWGDESASYIEKTELATCGATANSIADLNGDGYLDIVFSNLWDGTTRNINSYIYWGDKSYVYSIKTELATHGAIGNSIADLNGDGYLDIVFSNYYNDSATDINSYIYWGDESASYSVKTELATRGTRGNSISDLDEDGYLDIVFSNYKSDNNYSINSYIYWGDESGSYSEKTELLTHGTRGNSIADLNGDGYLDIVFSNYHNGNTNNINSYICWGDASNSYSSKTELPTHGAVGVSAGNVSTHGQNFILGVDFENQPAQVSNLSAQQRNDGTGIVDIHYDIFDNDGDNVYVSIEVSNDGGVNWSIIDATYMTGDVGVGIPSGINKHIEWNPTLDIPFGYNENYRIKVIGHYLIRGYGISNVFAIRNIDPNTDTDNDGMPDKWELQYGFNPQYEADSEYDNDNDKLINLYEYTYGTHPFISDTDNDGLSDYEESNGVFIIFDDFESGDLTKLTWISYPSDPYYWEITLDEKYKGNYSLCSPEALSDNERSNIEINITLLGETEFSFYYKISSELYRDYFLLYIDSEFAYWAYGEINWTKYSINLTEGKHDIVFTYSKNSTISEGSDKVWIDNINFESSSYLTSPIKNDTDNDGMPDGWEISNNFNPIVDDGHNDNDGDLLINSDEYTYGTDPFAVDTDNDGMPDGWEVSNNLNPLYNDADSDADNDGLSNFWEFKYDTRVDFPDTDNDGLWDGEECLSWSEFSINNYTINSQENVSITANEENYLAVWSSWLQDGDGDGIYGQLFDCSGNKIGSEFQINTYHRLLQMNPSVSSNANSYLVGWCSYFQDGHLGGIYAQLYDSSGNKLGIEFRVNTYTMYSQESVCIETDGENYLVTWMSSEQDGSDYGVFAQLLDNSGTRIGTEFQVNTYTPNSQYGPRIASNGSNYLVIWMSAEQDGSECGVYGQFLDNSGTKIGTEFQVNTHTLGAQSVPEIASDGINYFVVWNDNAQDASNCGVYGQILDSLGNKIGSEFQITTFTYSNQTMPSISSNGNNYFVVWESEDQDGSEKGIFGQVFDSSGHKVGLEIQINFYTDSNQAMPSISSNGNNYFVAWESEDQDGNEKGIFGSILDGYGTDPLYSDTDQDGITDGDEINTYKSNPFNLDTDDDGVYDGDEVLLDTDPNDPEDFFIPLLATQSPIEPGGENLWFITQPMLTLDVALTNQPTIYYKIDDNSWLEYSELFYIPEGEHELNFYAQFKPDKPSDIQTLSFKVDLDNPTIAISKNPAIPDGENGWYTLVPEITLSFSDTLSTAVGYYKIDDGSWSDYSSPILIVAGQHEFSFYSQDEAGRNSDIETAVIKVDLDNPTISASMLPSEPDGTNGWYITSPEITLNASDASSPVTVLYMLDNDGSWIEYISPIYIQDGEHEISFYTKDESGKASDTQSLNFKVDLDNPTIAISKNPAIPGGENSWYTVVPEITLSFSDTLSTAVGYYKIDDGSWSDYSSPILIDAGQHELSFYSQDEAGRNSDIETAVIKLDLDDPTISASILPSEPDGTNGWYITSPEITLNASDASSSVTILYMIDNDGSWIEYTFPIYIQDGEHEISFYAKDGSGKTSNLETLYFKTDSLVPQISVNLDGVAGKKNWYVSDVIASIEYICGLSGVSLSEYSVNGTDWQPFNVSEQITYDNEGIFLLNVRVESLAGQMGSSSTTIMIDQTPPPPISNLTADGNSTGTNVILSWTDYNEQISGDVEYYLIYADNESFTQVDLQQPTEIVPYGTFVYSVDNLIRNMNYYFAVVAMDDKGNAIDSVTPVTAVPIDVTAPDNVTDIEFQCFDDRLIISWNHTPNISGDLAGYKVYFDNDTQGVALSSTQNSYEKTGLEAASSYSVRVTAFDYDGNENSGSLATGVTLLPNPSNISIDPQNGYVNIAWDAIEKTNLLKYYLIYYSENDFQNVDGMNPAVVVTNNSSGVAGLINDVTYYFAVTSVNLSGGENQEVVTIPASPVPDTDGPEIYNLKWENVFFVNDQIVRKPGTFTLSAVDPVGVSRVEFLIDGESCFTDRNGSNNYSFYWNIVNSQDGSHLFTIIAFDTLGNATTVEYNVTVELDLPSAPTITSPSNGIITNNSLVNISGITEKYSEIIIYNNDIELSNPVTVNDNRFNSNITLIEGTNNIQVIASNRAGQSALSNEVTITLDLTIPFPPDHLEAQSKPNGIISISWNPPDESEVMGYNIYRANASFTDISVATKVNSNLITADSFNNLLSSDSTWYYRVSTLDFAGNESSLSYEVHAISDKTIPEVISIDYSPQGAFDIQTGKIGLGQVNVLVTVSEMLQTTPVFSITPNNGLTVLIGLSKISDLEYTGFFIVSEQTPSGTAYALFSGRDIVGNRGTHINSGKSIEIDTQGPSIIRLEVDPQQPIKNISSTPVTLNVEFGIDEVVKEGSTPTFSYLLSGDGRTEIVLNNIEEIATVSGDAQSWKTSFVLPSDAGLEETETLSFKYNSIDNLENVGSDIVCENTFEIYQGTLPPLAVPSGLTGDSLPDGKIYLTWYSVDDAIDYQLYRKSPEDTQLFEYVRTGNTNEFIDETLTDGIYHYAVSSIRNANGQESLSEKGIEVQLVSDSIPPPPPINLTLELVGNGIKAQWTEPTVTESISYSVYRSDNVEINSVEGLSPLGQGITQTFVVDPYPSSSEHCYAVTSVDNSGNESIPSNSVYLNFELLPVSSIHVIQSGTDYPTISWTHTSAFIAGYDIYTKIGNELYKLNDQIIDGSSYIDTGYQFNDRLYTIIAIDENAIESPGRDVLLPTMKASLYENTKIKRNLINRLLFHVENNSAHQVDNARLNVVIDNLSHISEMFSINQETSLDIPVIVGGYSDLPDYVDLTTKIEITPNEGEKVEIVANEEVQVTNGMLSLTIQNEEFTKGLPGLVRFSLYNTGVEEIEIVTATNSGNSSSNEVILYLMDNDGNILSSKPFKQSIGENVVTLPDKKTVARIPSGGVFVSDPIELAVPSSAPDESVVQLAISKIHYHCGKSEHVEISGLTANRQISLVETVYSGDVTEVFPEVSKGDQDITINGCAIDRGSGQYIPEVPLDLIVSVNGYERKYYLITDSSGFFSYTFQPLQGESGIYKVCAIHPDLLDRPEQKEFVINKVNISPRLIDLSIPKNYEKKINIKVKTGDGTSITNVRLVYDEIDQPSGEFKEGVYLQLDPSVNKISSDSSANLSFKIWADNSADQESKIILKLKSDDVDNDSWGTITINAVFSTAQPALYFSPSYIEGGVAQDESITESLSLENKGLADLKDVTLAIVSPDGSDVPAWVHLNSALEQGNIAVGEKRNLSLTFNPDSNVTEGIYEYYLRVTSSNYPVRDIRVYVNVTQAGIGNVLFKISDIYTATLDKNGNIIEGLSGARIYIQNENVTTVEHTKTTDNVGEALFNDLPTGSYKYRITAANHQENIGRFWIKPGVTGIQDVFLEYNIVSVEFEVVPTTIQDEYKIVLNATYQTNVPAPVVVAEPSSINLPDMQPGDIYNGEFNLVNYGLIAANDLSFQLPESDEFYQYELLEGIPDTLPAKERITIPYKVTCLSSYNAEDGTGGGCRTYKVCIKIDYIYKCINEHYVTGKISYCFFKTKCTGGSQLTKEDAVRISGGGGGGFGSFGKATSSIIVDGVICWPIYIRREITIYSEQTTTENETLQKVFHDVGCTVNTVAREFNDDETDLSIKVPGGNISVDRLFYGDTWRWEHLRNNLSFNLDALGKEIESINKGGVIYEKVSEGVYAQDFFRIAKEGNRYIWKDKNKNWKEYNSSGKLISYGNRNTTIGKLLYENDNSGQLIGIADRNDRQVIWYEYNNDGTIAFIYDLSGRSVNYAYSNGLLTAVIDVLDNESYYEYNSDSKITRKIDPAGRPTIISYDDYGNVQSVVDNDGNGHFFEYDYDSAKMEQYARITYSSGRVEEMWYDKNGETKRYDVNGKNIFKVTKDGRNLIITDEKGNITRKYLDDKMNITKIVYPDETSVEFEYEPVFNNLTSVTDARGNVTEYTYDVKGNLIKLTEAVGTNCERVITYSYDGFGQLMFTTIEAENDSYNSTITMTYDENGNLQTLEDTMGNTTVFLEYDNMGNVLQMQDARENIWLYEYDNMGRLTSQTDPLENTTSYEYDGANNQTAIINAYLKKFKFEYDDHNNMVKVIDPYDKSIVSDYNTDSLLTKVIDQEGKQSQLVYDNEKRLIKSIDGAGNEILYHYDEISESHVLSNKPVKIDYPTYSRELYYDKMQRLVKTVDILDNDTSNSRYFSYDDSGNLVSQTDEENNVTLYQYDALNRLVKTIDPLGGISEKIYDKRGNLAAIKDPNNGTTFFKYDLNNRIVEKTRPMGEKYFYEYDNTGNLIEVIDPKGQKISYTYNAINNVMQINYFTASDYQTPVKTVDFEYDKLGDLIEYDDGVTSAVYTYDDLQRKLSKTLDYGPFSLSYAYSYYANGLKKSFTGPDGSKIDYTYDDNNRLETINIPGSGQLTYNAYQWNNPAKITLPGGTTKEYFYDPLMRIQSIINKDPAQNTLLNYSYTYSPAGNITQKATGHGNYNYQYDKMFHLISADNPVNSNEAYTYDLLGNRLTSVDIGGTWQYNLNNQLTGFNNAVFEYDNNGNMLHRTIDSETTNYIYNIENRLISVQDSQSNIIAEYYYNPFGKRLWKDIDGTKTYFFYSDEGLVGEYDSNGNEIKTYAYEPGSLWMTEPLYQKIGSSFYWYHNDHQGTPQKITDSAGAVVWAATYDAFGNIQIDTQAIENNFRFPGQYYDSETGLYYNLNRYYDPILGRYLREDPFEEGLNLYDYVDANPLNAIDQEGLCKVKNYLIDVADILNPIENANKIWKDLMDFLFPKDPTSWGGEFWKITSEDLHDYGWEYQTIDMLFTVILGVEPMKLIDKLATPGMSNQERIKLIKKEFKKLGIKYITGKALSKVAKMAYKGQIKLFAKRGDVSQFKKIHLNFKSWQQFKKKFIPIFDLVDKSKKRNLIE